MAAYVRVNGFVKAAIGVGINEYANTLIMFAARWGRIRSGSRMPSAKSVDKLIDPKMVVDEWWRAAHTISLEDGAGTALR